jgi:hypothetical protein
MPDHWPKSIFGNDHNSTLWQADFLNSGDRITSPAPGTILQVRRRHRPAISSILTVQSKHYCVPESTKPNIAIAARSQGPYISSPDRMSAGKANQRSAPFQTARIANPNASEQVMTELKAQGNKVQPS